MQQLCKGNLGPSALTVLRLGGAHLGGYGEAWGSDMGSTDQQLAGILWEFDGLRMNLIFAFEGRLAFLLHFLHDIT